MATDNKLCLFPDIKKKKNLDPEPQLIFWWYLVLSKKYQW